MYYIGIDLGGTNIKGALVSETGEIAREVSRPTRVELGAEAVCDGIAAVIRPRALREQPRLEEL